MNSKKYSRNYGIGTLFIFTLLIGFLMQIFCADQSYSKTENRSLEMKPNFNTFAFFNGSYQHAYENYSNDQFPNRSQWMKMKTDIDIAMGVRYIQDVYIAKDQMLIQKVDYPENNVNGEASADAINAFFNRHTDLSFSFILAPNKIGIYQDLLPENAVTVNQEKSYEQFYASLDENIHKINAMQILKAHKDEYIFYKSDHHWTTLAAKYIADEFLGKDEIEYNVVVSNDHFSGTLSNKIAYYPFTDTISLYLPKENTLQYVVDYVESHQKATSVYEMDKQLDTDAYAIYFGGNHPIIKINTTSSVNKRLLLFKDSYANCFIPFLLPYYSEIVVVDPRYYYDDVDQLIQDERISDVLFLYNMNTLFSDDSLFTLKTEE